MDPLVPATESSTTMAEATGEGATPLHGGLPDEIVIWEILVRLPPKSLLRCRAVRRAWRRATSTRDFLLAHHARQPTLPLVCGYLKTCMDIVPFDHRAAAAADQLQSVARLDDAFLELEASCDGLLILSDDEGDIRFSICNPATREYAPLPQLDDLRLLGMYRNVPTGEYRLLAEFRFGTHDDQDGDDEDGGDDQDGDDEDGGDDQDGDDEDGGDDQDGFYVFTLGSSQPPRYVGCPNEWEVIQGVPVVSRGSLHWYTGQMITVFDTTAESFRQMRSPVVSCEAEMFEIGGMLGISSFKEDETTAVDIWVMQDYEGEAWTFKQRVELPVAELAAQFGEFKYQWRLVVQSWDDGDMFGLVRFGEWLLQIDMDGKLVASFQDECLTITPLWFKQSLFPHTFFATLEGYVVNGSPFI